jgi:hypothetical protein
VTAPHTCALEVAHPAVSDGGNHREESLQSAAARAFDSNCLLRSGIC